ncbi:chromosome partitioning protein ParA, partial [Streptosporangium sandarakinum]
MTTGQPERAARAGRGARGRRAAGAAEDTAGSTAGSTAAEPSRTAEAAAARARGSQIGLVPVEVRPAAPDHDVVGDRVLIAVQAVNISRLSTHPVPIVPGTLIVVAGAGPKDSNGAGKSSFIAMITALLGDEQWRFASGAKAVAELLFNAELAAGGGAGTWASADHGYIVGVFAPPGSVDDAVTVWLRVNQEAPHLEIRVVPGIRPASAPSEAERVALADEVWASLPRSAGRRDVVARDLTRFLYGDRVRCVSFLSTSVRSKVATNLLSQPLNEISPERERAGGPARGA